LPDEITAILSARDHIRDGNGTESAHSFSAETMTEILQSHGLYEETLIKRVLPPTAYFDKLMQVLNTDLPRGNDHLAKKYPFIGYHETAKGRSY
jgi:hypothetical protein